MFRAIEPALIRYQAIDAPSFRVAVMEIAAHFPPKNQ
jgi:hypothetical protein